MLKVQRHALATFEHMHGGGNWCGLFFGVGALLGAAFAVEHVGTGNFVVTATHETEFCLVLYIFNMKGAAAWT